MKTITYVTGNQMKFDQAAKFFEKHDIGIVQQKLDTYEIQSAHSLEVAQSKAHQAWDQLHAPLFINDTSWSIPALGGFPGPYMKYVNDWFSAADFLNLMRDHADRTIILRDTIVYMDELGSQVFTNDLPGKILDTAYSGKSLHPSDTVISLTDDGKSLAELYAAGDRFILPGEDIVWNQFAQWLQTK